MPGEEIPVTPSVVTWARDRAGFSPEEANQKFKNFHLWEAGEAYPTYPQLEQLAELFKLPIAVFFFPEPPSVPPIRDSFRTLPDHEFEQIPRRIRFLLRKAKALQLNLAELNDGRNPAQRMVTTDLILRANDPIDAMAEQVRRYLDVSIERQHNWPSDEVALENWRQILNDVGVFVFKDAFKVSEYSGFCLYDETFPIIYVNNSSTKTRQIFTLFHELAHLLFHTSGIDTLTDEYIAALPDAQRRIEIICNRFAAHFLVPEAAFGAMFVDRQASENTAEELAAYFHVSREVIFRRFLDRNLIDEAAYTRAARRWTEQRRPGSGGDYYNNQFIYLGSPYITLALKQYYQNRIDDTRLAEYLNIAAKNLNTFEVRFSRRGA